MYLHRHGCEGTHKHRPPALLLPGSIPMPPEAGGIKMRQKPALPTQQDSSSVPPCWTPPPSSQLGNSLDFPEGQPTRTGSDLPAQCPHRMLSKALASAPASPTAKELPALPRKSCPRPLQPFSDMECSGLGASGQLCLGPAPLKMLLRVSCANGVKPGRPGNSPSLGNPLWGDKSNSYDQR